MKLNLLALSAMTAIIGVNSAKAFDVVPKKLRTGSTYVRITNPTPNTVRFEECISGYEENGCSQIGRKSSYTKKELIKQRTTENWQILGSAAADVAILGGLIFGGAYMGAAAGAYSSGGAVVTSLTPVFVGGVVGGTVGTAAGAGIVGNLDALNPFEQTAQAETLNTEVLEDEKVIVENVDEFIERLELVLSKI